MPLITPEELIVLLDLPADTEPTDRAQLVCDLVLDKVADAAGLTSSAAIVAPYPAGAKGIALTAAARLYDNPTALRSATVDDVTQNYPEVVSVLTDDEKSSIATAFGSTSGRTASAPTYTFPTWDWTWAASGASTISG